MLLGLVLMWGTSFMFNRVALQALSPSAVVTLRLAIGAVVLSAVVRAGGFAFPRTPTALFRFGLLGVVGFSLPFYLISWGQQRIDSGLAGILMAVMPLATLLLAHVLVEGERITARRGAGFVLGFAGVVVLVGPAALRRLGGGQSDLLSQLAVLGGAICYAINTILARRISDGNALVTSAGVTGVATLTVLPALAVEGPAGAIGAASVGWATVGAVAWLGLISTAAATLVYFRLVASAGPTFLSLINYLIPIVAVAVGVVFLGERPEMRSLAALALVLAGLALGELRGRSSAGRGE